MAKRTPARRKRTGRSTETRKASAGANRARSARGAKSASSRARTSKRPSSAKGGRKTAGAKRSTKAAGRSGRTKTAAATAAASRKPAPAGRSSSKKRPAAGRGDTAGGGTGISRTAAPRRKNFGKRGPGSLRTQIDRDLQLMEEEVPTPPSSLDLERRPSAARSGRASREQRLAEHHRAGAGITSGDVDADWESADTVGDTAPGGDMPTPDQDVVEEIGAAVGVRYADDEELKGARKVEQRDRHRWELDPASSEDYPDRTRRRP